MERKLSHEEMMEKAWEFIEGTGIADKDDTKIYENADYKVENIYQVRDAYYSDLETGEAYEDDSVEAFLARHNIEWK